MAYNVPSLLADLLKPLVGKTEYFVKNTASFSKDLKGIKMEGGEIMNSHDLVSLFTNVHIPQALEVGWRLRPDNSLPTMSWSNLFWRQHIFSMEGKYTGKSRGHRCGSGGGQRVHGKPWGDTNSYSPATDERYGEGTWMNLSRW